MNKKERGGQPGSAEQSSEAAGEGEGEGAEESAANRSSAMDGGFRAIEMDGRRSIHELQEARRLAGTAASLQS